MKAWTFRSLLLAALAPSFSALAQPAAPPHPAGSDSAQSDKNLPQRAAVVKYVLIMPNDKTSESVKPEDRNPFGRLDDESKQFKGTSEEVMIRDRIMKLRVCGASLDTKGEVARVMLGDMILTPGMGLPAVIQNQSLALRVGSMSKNAIELIWIEKKPIGLPARKLVVPVDLRPFVRYRLLGQEPGAKPKNGKSKNGDDGMGLQFTAELSNVPLDAIPAALKNHLPGLPDSNPNPNPNSDTPPPDRVAATAPRPPGLPSTPSPRQVGPRLAKI